MSSSATTTCTPFAKFDLYDVLCWTVEARQVRFTVTAGQEIEALWQEYEDGKSPEALMVKDFDKVWKM